MILPLGDAPNPRGVPFMTYALIAANVAAYALITVPLGATPADPTDPALREYLAVVTRDLPQVSLRELLRGISSYDLFLFRHGFRPGHPAVGPLFASLFLHAGFLHLFGNMLFLWIYGDNVEHRLGRLPFLVCYLMTGVAATLFHTVFASHSDLPLVGASGAISGVLGFYFLWFPRNEVRLLFLFFPFFMDVIMVSARVVLAVYLVADNVLPFLLTRGGGGGGVAYGAHIGGFLGGLGMAWLLDRRELLRQPDEYKGVRVAAVPGETPGRTIAHAVAEGRFPQAAQDYFALESGATRRMLTPEDSLALADWLRRNGHDEAALVVYRRHLRDYPHGPGAAEAHVGAALVLLEAFGQATPAYQHLLDALDLDPSPETAAQARAALAAIRARQKRQVGHPSGRKPI
ncbi:MAG: rane associated serine protease, rhomboid family [Deltaproteobacteria bacterium]|nr:rane associated serine protease, rhomboid family [Deltaproteobacteria bacterium]